MVEVSTITLRAPSTSPFMTESMADAAAQRRSLPRTASFVSARDSSYWLSVASASSSSSFGSSRSSVGPNSRSFLDLRATTVEASGVRGSAPRLQRFLSQYDTSLDRPDDGEALFGLSLDNDDDTSRVSEDNDDDETNGEDRVELERDWMPSAPITSPPPPSGGLRVPTRLQNHRHRLGSASTASPPVVHIKRPSPTPQIALSIPSTTTRAAELTTDIAPDYQLAVEEVFEHQRYQMVLGWGSKGHLLPLDPGKYVRVLRGRRRRRSSITVLNPYDSEHFDTVHSPIFPDVALPESPSETDKWEWISPWHLELPLSDEPGDAAFDPTDSDGWSYASSFHHFPVNLSPSSPTASGADDIFVGSPSVSSSPSPKSRGRHKFYVRRRKWIRYRVLRSTRDAFLLDDLRAFDDSFLDSMCGWLRKLGHVRKNWKLRYFVLEKSILRYYADEAMTRLKGEVLLFHPAARVHYVDIRVAGGRDNAFAIQIGSDYSLLLQADRIGDRENWMYCIEDALLCRDSYYQDPERTRDVRDSVARRRKISTETMIFNVKDARPSGQALGLNPVNVFMLHSWTGTQAARKNPLLMRLMVESDVYMESKAVKQQIACFVQKFKQKYPTSSCGTPNKSSMGGGSFSRTTSPVSTNSRGTSKGRRSVSFDVPFGEDALSVEEARSFSALVDPRSMLALKNYRFFVERSVHEVMSHLHRLPFANASIDITSPKRGALKSKKNSADAADEESRTSTESNESEAQAAAGQSEIDWEMVKKAVLYKFERQTFIPLQDVIYGLLEASVVSSDLEHFERNRQYLAVQPQRYFEIQESHNSPSNWKSAIALLNSMDNYSLPSEKASILLAVAKCIYDTYAQEHTVDTGMMAADDFLPIFIFVLARSTLRNVVISRYLISETMTSAVMIGETGYYATMLEAAVSYIATLGMGVSATSPPHPQRGTSTPFKAAPKSKSPAAKARQAEIERENLKMIKKIVELQGTGTRKRRSTASVGGLTGRESISSRSRPPSASSTRHHSVSSSRGDKGEEMVFCDRVGGSCGGQAGVGSVPVPNATSHPLYTRHSSTMTHHFPEQNDIVLNGTQGLCSNAAQRQRTQVKIIDENRKLLQRILTTKKSFSRNVWTEEEKQRRKLMENISRFSHLPSSRRPSSATPAKRSQLSSMEMSPPRSFSLQGTKHQSMAASSHSLAILRNDGPNGRGGELLTSGVIRTGSPVTHLRRQRPASASAASRSMPMPKPLLTRRSDVAGMAMAMMMDANACVLGHESTLKTNDSDAVAETIADLGMDDSDAHDEIQEQGDDEGEAADDQDELDADR
ncbi:hypothetical protein Poli38472_014635 [Pythium oligandrum]|uniref:VPS9 domain-containing protein n=1 Tax=Pythium oligandrum TaxID=41045 RepID=A0A8K1FHI4_PYTOL|nr:hypothetical protein Poli38472_014635 [Pythium oligandrum]|eukprot:TMW63930.1 hypothetical protein Poli38472_014635 [Pythium oligandrum]